MTTKGRSVADHPLAGAVVVSKHACYRWVTRIGIGKGFAGRREKDIVLHVLDLLLDAIPVTETLFYSHGVLLGVTGDTVATVFKPETHAQKMRVRKALQRERARRRLDFRASGGIYVGYALPKRT